jgi:hypothetical protein
VGLLPVKMKMQSPYLESIIPAKQTNEVLAPRSMGFCRQGHQLFKRFLQTLYGEIPNGLPGTGKLSYTGSPGNRAGYPLFPEIIHQ